jgi:PAS domain S-box-containing protein
MNFNKNIAKPLDSEPQKLAKDSILLKFKQISQLENKQMSSKPGQNKFQTLVEKTQALIFILQEQQISYVNPVAEVIIGYSQSQLSSSNVYDQLNPKGWNPNQLKQGCSQELKIVNKKGQEYWLSCDFTTIDFNEQPGIMITAFDVTKYKQALVKTQKAITAEQEHSKSKASFVSMVSHEFRTPLNIISFSTSLLKRYLQQWTEEKQLKYLDRLQTAVEQLNHLMDEVLIIGRAEAGKLKFDPQPLNLTLFCQQLLKEINLSQPKQLNINFVNLLTHKTILLDKNLLKIVLVNLLGNAIKYSPSDSTIELVVSCQNDYPPGILNPECLFPKGDYSADMLQDRLILQIKDQGIGIPWEEQTKIFEPFHRSSNVGDLPGNGMGLAIAHKLVELQGGKIVLQSQLETGSTFTVILPLRLP